jgi:hypothetical protein
MDVWTYFDQREREATQLSLAPEGPFDRMCAEEDGSNGTRGRIFGRFVLTDGAYLQIHELVEVEGNGIHRIEYGYFLVIDGIEVWGYERDPNHEAEGLLDHRHTEEHQDRIKCDPISFKEVVELAWEEASTRGMLL